MKVDVTKLEYREVNEKLRESGSECTLTGCLGQRFIAAGMADREITIEGTPGNALGAYLNGATINVCGNAQDAVGDTMNAGRIVVHGNIGDAAGYAMRGGRIYVQGNAGYRAGIHMKAYKDNDSIKKNMLSRNARRQIVSSFGRRGHQFPVACDGETGGRSVSCRASRICG